MRTLTRPLCRRANKVAKAERQVQRTEAREQHKRVREQHSWKAVADQVHQLAHSGTLAPTNQSAAI